MFSAGSMMYLWVPEGSAERVLHPGKVLRTDIETFVGEFEEPLAPRVGTEAYAYCEFRGRFMQQAVSVIDLRPDQPQPAISFRRLGAPISVTKRSTYRVSVAALNLRARIGCESKCAVVDLSPEGLGVVTRKEHELGALEEVELIYDGQVLVGQARVQAVRLRPDGRYRYGFFALEVNGRMRRVLERLSASVQRMQLRNLARSA